ncbi:MAG: tRNA-modifying protein YgfZ, partial [Paraperlucidibaca sp.]
ASGEVSIDQTLVDHWQPQELDYHTLGGVSYQKGCYMGQEIVARLYFRGQLKTGLCWLRAPWPDGVDAALEWPIMANDKAVGRVIALAWPDAHELWLLASVRLEAENLQWALPDGSTVALTRHDFIRQG